MSATAADKPRGADAGGRKHTEATSQYDVMGPAAALVVIGFFARYFVASKWALESFRLDNDNSREVVALGVAIAAMVLVGWGMRLAEEGRPLAFQRLRDRLMLVLGMAGVMGYFNFGHLHFGGFVHVWDTYHYYIGSKYASEVGYDRMYDCAAVVDAENGRLAEVQRRNHTDLRTNLITPTREVIENADQICKQYFTPERWAQYTRDINSIRSMVNENRWKEIHVDHGYNATPVWTLAGKFFANLQPATSDGLIAVNLLDPIYIFLAMLMIWWAFGVRGFAMAGIVLGCNFPNRYYWTGGAFLRHDWLFYLVASVCLLKKEKHFLGGLSFSYTVLLRLFPGLAAIGPALAAVEYFRRNKKLEAGFLKYLAGGAVGTVGLVGLTFALLPSTPPNKLTVELAPADSGATKVIVTRVDAKTGTPTSWLKGPNLFPSSSLPGLATTPLEGSSGFILGGTVAPPESPITEASFFSVKIGGDETLQVPIAVGDTAASIAQRVKEAFDAKAVRDADGSGVALWKRFSANTVKHASTPLTNLMGLKTWLTWRPSTVGAQMTDRLLIDAWKPWKEKKIELWNQMKPVFAVIVLAAIALLYLAIRHSGPQLYLGACLGVALCVIGAELTNYYYCFLLCMAALYAEKREVGLLMAGLSAVTLFINFGWLQFQSHDLDQQYTAMSAASVVAMFFVIWSFTKWGEQGAPQPEPDAGPWHNRWVLVGLALMSLFVLYYAVQLTWGAPIGDASFGVKVWIIIAGVLFAVFKLAARDAPVAANAGQPPAAPLSGEKKKAKKKR
ncbi:MAG: hypothetical protein JNJ54_02025 [Myxococcaceae bacterium]|nr:hypothetical protein [Myxococcaceae bacterium]